MRWVNGEDLSGYSDKTESAGLRKCPDDHWLTNEAYLSAIAVTNIPRSFYLRSGGKNQLAYRLGLNNDPMYKDYHKQLEVSVGGIAVRNCVSGIVDFSCRRYCCRRRRRSGVARIFRQSVRQSVAFLSVHSRSAALFDKNIGTSAGFYA